MTLEKRRSEQGSGHLSEPRTCGYHHDHMDELAELTIGKLVTGGAGLAFHEGMAVFVPLSVPGDRLEVRLQPHGRWFTAEILSILEPGSGRIEASCPLFGECGGCNLQHLSYAVQLESKSAILRELFIRTAHFDPGVIETCPSQPFGYRNRMQFHLSSDGRIGLARRDSADIVQLGHCPVADPAIDRWLGERLRLGRKAKDLKAATGGKDRFIVYGAEGAVAIEGRDRDAEVRVAGDTIRFPVTGFFQSNLGMISRLVEREILAGGAAADRTRNARAVDLYAGVGLFAHFLAKSHQQLVCVESDARTLEYARSNTPAGTLLSATGVDAWTASVAARQRYDTVLADPPRTGLGRTVTTWLAQADVETFIYISCDPATLARDSQALLASGWHLESLRLYDFYPHTGHIESAARFVRNPVQEGVSQSLSDV